jgi:hypothetical protein
MLLGDGQSLNRILKRKHDEAGLTLAQLDKFAAFHRTTQSPCVAPGLLAQAWSNIRGGQKRSSNHSRILQGHFKLG